MQNAPREHSAIFFIFIKLPFVFKTFVLSIFEWPLKTGFTVFLDTTYALMCLIVCEDRSVNLSVQYVSVIISGCGGVGREDL